MTEFHYDVASGITLPKSWGIEDGDTDLMFLISGQSLAQGGCKGAERITPPGRFNGKALMLSGGPMAYGHPLRSDAYSELAELEPRESIASGFASRLLEKFESVLGVAPRIIITGAAVGGSPFISGDRPIDGMKRGSYVYAEMLRLVAAAQALSAKEGRKLVVKGHLFLHGEADFGLQTARWQYRRALENLATDLGADLQAITGQNEIVRHFTYQCAKATPLIDTPSEIALAQLDVDGSGSRWSCVGPIYWTDVVDPTHPTSPSYRRMGRQFGDAVMHDAFGPYWSPLRVVEHWWSSADKITLRYSHPIMIADDGAIDPSGLDEGMGYEFYDGPPQRLGSAKVVAIECAKGQATDLEITLSNTPTGKNPRLIIGQRRTGDGGGRLFGGRTLVRSRTPFTTDPLDGFVQFHWACMEVVKMCPGSPS
jgi:Carbohydrate esterase, sialic acid-specific acetylesterase